MNKDLRRLMRQIEKDVEKKCANVLKNTYITVTEQIETSFEQSLDAFYEHKAFWNKNYKEFTSTPRRYKRGYNLYYASNRFSGLLRTAEEIEHDKANVALGGGRRKLFGFGHDKNDNSPVAGIWVSGNYIPGNPYGYNKNEIFERAYAEGIHGFKRGESAIGHAPLMMKPTPERLMHRAFWHIRSQRNINGIIDENIKREFEFNE